jgi:Uma2 family endonuclease
VKHAWILDPVSRSLEVYRNSGKHWLMISTHGGEEKVRAEPFDAIELELAALWPPG